MKHIFNASFPSMHVQRGAVKLVLCGHWMHLSYMHRVTSENQFHSPPPLYFVILGGRSRGSDKLSLYELRMHTVSASWASSVQCWHWSRHLEKASFIPHAWVTNTCKTRRLAAPDTNFFAFWNFQRVGEDPVEDHGSWRKEGLRHQEDWRVGQEARSSLPRKEAAFY